MEKKCRGFVTQEGPLRIPASASKGSPGCTQGLLPDSIPVTHSGRQEADYRDQIIFAIPFLHQSSNSRLHVFIQFFLLHLVHFFVSL